MRGEVCGPWYSSGRWESVGISTGGHAIKRDSLISLRGPSPRSHGGEPCAPRPGSHLHHRHLPNQPLPLHPGANCPAPAQCVTSGCRPGQRRPRPHPRGNLPLRPRRDSAWPPPPPTTLAEPPRGALAGRARSPDPGVRRARLRGGRGSAPLLGKEATRARKTWGRLLACCLIPSSAPPPHSTWGAAVYPVESVKSHSLKGMKGGNLGLGPTSTQLTAPQARRSRPGATSVCASQGLSCHCPHVSSPVFPSCTGCFLNCTKRRGEGLWGGPCSEVAVLASPSC